MISCYRLMLTCSASGALMLTTVAGLLLALTRSHADARKETTSAL